MCISAVGLAGEAMLPVPVAEFWLSNWQAPEHAPYLCCQVHAVASLAQARSQSQGSGA